MIIDYTTREIISKYVNEYVPEGIHEQYHVDCREHTEQIIEAMIENNVIDNKETTIEAVCLCWNEFMYRKFSILN